MTKKITEKMLLDGYAGITVGMDNISVIEGERIIWDYREGFDGTYNAVCSYGNAHEISLKYDRRGTIDISDDNSDHPAIEAIRVAREAIAGTYIN